MKQLTRTTIGAVLLSAGLIIAAPVMAQLPAAQEQNGITYITGGVGTDEAHAFQSVRGQYNLQLTVTMKDGTFLADIPVKVINSRNQTVLDTTTDGPYLFAKLPAGRYQVVVGDSRVQKRTVQVGGKGGANVHFVY